MRLHLLRHGDAVPSEDPDYEEAQRPLTDEGARQVREAAQGLGAMYPGIDRVATSPYTRARQTAEIVIETLGLQHVDLAELDVLVPNTDPTSTRSGLIGLRPADSVLVTGHKPNLPRLAANLLTGDSEGLDLEFPTASLCTIDMALGTPAAQGQLIQHVHAEHLRKLG